MYKIYKRRDTLSPQLNKGGERGPVRPHNKGGGAPIP